MEQHPIPQQISSYEFQLVGSMTLKQFGKLAGGLIIAFIFYSSNIIFFIKWPLIIAFAGLGFALAFVPVNERPMEFFILSFIRSIFSPTIYLWDNQNKNIDILSSGFAQKDEKDRQKEEEERSKEIEIQKEIETLKMPKLNEFISSIPEDSNNTIRKGKPDKKSKPKQSEPSKLKEEIAINIREQEPAKQAPVPVQAPTFQEEINAPERSAPPTATAEPEFGEIPMPKPPTTPNIIVGMVTDSQGKILDNVIVEIQDQEGNPIRALRTNQLGQFRTTAPIPNGDYLIISEKENYRFDIIKIKAKGEVIPPLKIKAKIA